MENVNRESCSYTEGEGGDGTRRGFCLSLARPACKHAICNLSLPFRLFVHLQLPVKSTLCQAALNQHLVCTLYSSQPTLGVSMPP